MQEIMTLLLPLIEKENEEKQNQTNVVELAHKMRQEQKDMLKVHEERQLQGGTIVKSSGSSKRKQPKFTHEMESQLEINAVHRDQEEAEEQARIQRKVQKIRSMDAKKL